MRPGPPLGLPELLGPACRERDLAYVLIVSRVVRPRPKLSMLAWWDDVTLGVDLGVAGASRDEVYAAMDPTGGRSRSGCFPGNTADPRAFIDAVGIVRDKFALTELTLVGNRGMITSARIEALKDLGGLSWITCLRAPAIKALTADDGPLQVSLFDTHDLAEITHPDYPGERLIACRNLALTDLRDTKRQSMLAATEALLATITARVQAGRLAGADAIGVAVGKVIDR